MLAHGDEDRLLMIPGPTPVAREILDALARPTISHTSTQLSEMFRDVIERLKSIADNPHGKAFVFAGSGTLAQEASIINFLGTGDHLLVASNGYFADRLFDIAKQHGIACSIHRAVWGTSVTGEALDRAMSETRATAVAFTHVETSTGCMAPLEQLMAVIRSHEAMSIVDGVAAFGGIPERMEELGIDVLLTGSQKALGIPPGLSIIFCGAAAWNRRVSRTDMVRAYYADLTRWEPVMEQPHRYFSTHPVNLIYALSAALDIIDREGLAPRFARHERVATEFRGELLRQRFELYTDPDYVSPTVSAVRTPAGVSASAIRTALHYLGVVAAVGINDAEDRVLRFGHMGNITGADVATALFAIRDALAGSQ